MKGWAARPSLSFAEPNREGVVTRNVLGSYRCPFGEPVQSVKGWGAASSSWWHCWLLGFGRAPCPFGGLLQIVKGKLSKRSASQKPGLGYLPLPLRGRCPRGRQAWCQSPSFTQAPRKGFLPLAKLGPLRTPRWRLLSPQRRLVSLWDEVQGF